MRNRFQNIVQSSSEQNEVSASEQNNAGTPQQTADTQDFSHTMITAGVTPLKSNNCHAAPRNTASGKYPTPNHSQNTAKSPASEPSVCPQQQTTDQQDFVHAMAIAGVTPLKSSNRHIAMRDTSPIKRRRRQEQPIQPEHCFYVGDSDDEPPTSFSKNNHSKNLICRLRNRHWPIAARIDLHGYTQQQTQQVLNEFIVLVRKRGGVCGEIIHGSGLNSPNGKAVLKNLVRRWLMAHPDILAYIEPHRNNDGAVIVLLKRAPKACD